MKPEVLVINIVLLLIADFLLLWEVVKQARLLDQYVSELLKANMMNQELQQQGNLETIIYNGDLFVNGKLHTGADGCLVADESICSQIGESEYADEWRDACLESPNIVDGDLCLEGKIVKVHGSVYVLDDAFVDEGSTGFIARDALKRYKVAVRSQGGGRRDD